MFGTQFKRVVRSGMIGFVRNRSVSFSAIVVMTATLFTFAMIIFLKASLEHTLILVQNKVDVNVYFATTAPDNKIAEIKSQIDSLAEVATTSLVSREQAMADFQEKHQDDNLILQSLEELNDNPFGASLNIRAKKIGQYESIAKFLATGGPVEKNYPGLMTKVNYNNNKPVFDRLSSLIDTVDFYSKILIAVLIFISLLVTFTTIRLATFVSREEIGIMRLVGASNLYIRGPFIIEAMLYGVVSTLLTLIILYPVTYWLGKHATNFLGGLNLFGYYISQFPYFLGVLLGSGVLIGAVSSFLAVRKYLNK